MLTHSCVPPLAPPAGWLFDHTGSWGLALFAPSIFFFLTGSGGLGYGYYSLSWGRLVCGQYCGFSCSPPRFFSSLGAMVSVLSSPVLSHRRRPPAFPPTLHSAAAYVKWGSADRQDFGNEDANEPLAFELWFRSLLPSGSGEGSGQEAEGTSAGGAAGENSASTNGAGPANKESASAADVRTDKRKH